MCKVKEVRLYSNGGDDDRTAFTLLKEADIPFATFGPTSEEPTPFIEYGHWKFIGIQEVREFVKAWKEKRLPPPYINQTEAH